MTELLRVMQIIDANSNILPEGNYLELCNLLKKSYETRVDPVYLFDYDQFNIPPITQGILYEHFYDHYFEKSIRRDCDFVRVQLKYLQDELEINQPLKRITKAIKEKVHRHCCRLQGDLTYEMSLTELSLDEKEFRKMCKMFLEFENDFRMKYRCVIVKRILALEDFDERLLSL